MSAKIYRTLLAFLVLFLLCAGAPPVSAQGQSAVYSSGPELVILADPAYSSLRIPASPSASMPRRNAASSIAVTFISSGNPDPGSTSYTCSEFPAEAKAAYLFAASIWANYITSPVTIRISACWRQLPPGYLGSAGPNLVASNGLPKNNHWYPLALADALSGSDLYPTYYDITSRFTSDIGAAYGPWYFLTDGNPPFGSYDFASVVLHEIGHGLGFTGSMTVSGGLGKYGLCAGATCYPLVYDDFTQAQDGSLLTSLASGPNVGSTQLAAALTSAAYFSGPKATTANAGQRVPLYTPSTWQQGSSYSHLGSLFDGTPNALMTYSLNNGESVHDPGPVSLGILGDIGWTIQAGTSAPAAPSNLNLPNVTASEIDLGWTDNSNNETGFQIERSPDGAAWVPLATTLANATTYADTSVSGGTKYFYRVRAVSGTYASAYAVSAPAITPGPPPPPGALAAMPAGETRIDLSWQDNSNIESGYIIERSDDLGATWTTLTTTAANATTYSDNGLGVAKTYQYRVSTASSQGNSALAGPVSATTWSVVNYNFLGLIAR